MEADAKMTSPRLIFIQHFILLSPTPAIQIYSHLKLQVSGFKAEQTSVRVNYGASGRRGGNLASGFGSVLVLVLRDEGKKLQK